MRKRRIVELGLVLLCTNLMLVAASVPDQGLRDARSAASANGAMLSRAAQSPAPDQPTAPDATARSVITPKTSQVQTPAGVLTNSPELQASPAAAKSAATPAQNSIVKTPVTSSPKGNVDLVPPNDNCANATYFVLGTDPVQFCDDNTGATEDCPALSGGAYREAWYKFDITQTTSVNVRYCGTSPAFYNAYIVMDTTCPCSGAWIFASSWEQTTCGDGNWTLSWTNLPAGTYYWPLLTDSAGGYAEGPYCVTFEPYIPPPPPECPAGSLFGQGPHTTLYAGYTSAVGPSFEYTCYDNFWNVTGKIGDIHWWGLKAYFDPYYGWTTCTSPDPLQFEVNFYQAGATPGALVASYLVTPTETMVDPGYWYASPLYYYSVDQLQPCVNMSSGWVSIQSQAHPAGCVFLWVSSPTGDYSAYQQPAGGGYGQLGIDLAFCLTGGSCPDIFGACCDDYTGVCTDGVEWGQCSPPLRFTPETLCADISPTCGIRGACCSSDLVCLFTGFESECDAVSGRFFPGQTCPEWVCPADCEHRIDLWDCYGDGWNGNTLDVLVNGVTVLSQITLASGVGPATYFFQAATGALVQTVYYPYGGWPYEPYYFIYDGLGVEIARDGIVGSDCYVQPTGITTYGNCDPYTTGACCYFAGGCEMTPPEACDPAIGLFLGLGSNCTQCPCFVPCPPEGIPEQEPCGQDTNGGCNAAGWPFEPIACGTTICGTMWANASLRDTDWYQLTLTDGQYLTWSGASQVPLLLFIIQGAGPNDCSSYSILASATAGECQTATIGPIEGAPGVTYWFWAGPSAWNNWPCDKDYTATLTCAPVPTGACCPPSGVCFETTPGGCAAANGIYQGDYVPCGSVSCEPFYCSAGAIYCDEYISRVQIDTIDNSTGCSPGQYGDYTYLGPAILPIGVGTTCTVTNGNPIWSSDTCTIWIDWNKDYVFDDDSNENLGDIPGVGPYTFTITPPTGAVFVPTRMRIRIDYANGDPDPCGVTYYGEVEDYTVVVQEVLGACCLGPGCIETLPSQCVGFWVGPFTTCSGLDCNGNGDDDLCDIISGYSQDCDGNGIPDECQTWCDCNQSGTPDFCDVADGTSLDCNENGIPDECDVPPFCQAGQPCFPATCSSDCQPDLVPDECQLAGGLACQLDDGSSENNWGLTAGGELACITHMNCGPGSVTAVATCFGSPAFPGASGVSPGMPFRVYVWGDADGNGVPTGADFLGEATGAVDAGSIDTDVVQVVSLSAPVSVGASFFVGMSVNTPAGGYPAPADDNGQSQVDQGFLTFNSIPFDPTNLSSLYPMSLLGYPTTVFIVRSAGGGGGGDCNGNGLPDDCDVPPPCGNCEGPDCSQDCNGDCVPDECQLGCGDCNGNGRPDDCDIASGSSLDCNANGIPDECDLNPADPDCNGAVSPDCNGDLIPDECQLEGNDCNNNNVPDDCDIASGASCDCQPDGIPDECQIWVEGPRDILSWDDGSTENSLGLTAGGELCWIAHYTVAQPGTIQGIQTSFGTPLYPGGSGVSAGQAVRVYVWSDPNGDGNPADAVFLSESAGQVEAGSIDTDVPQTIAIAQPISDSFFVGASVVTSSGYPSPMDENGPQYNQAWIAFNAVPFDPSNFVNLYNMTDIGYPCNWLLRTVVTFGAPPNDCNENGVPDECDIGVEFGGFCSNPGAPCYPAECTSDWNSNGTPDNCEICGDINNNGAVDIDDYWMFVDAFGTCVGDPKYNLAADMDLDGCITLVDYQAWRMCYKMYNGKDFVAPKAKPMPIPKPNKKGSVN